MYWGPLVIAPGPIGVKAHVEKPFDAGITKLSCDVTVTEGDMGKMLNVKFVFFLLFLLFLPLK